jgi:hypothetical protein
LNILQFRNTIHYNCHRCPDNIKGTGSPVGLSHG